MSDPLSIHGIQSALSASQLNQANQLGPAATPEGKTFKDLLIDGLQQVNQLQSEAAQGIEQVSAGASESITEVFNAVQKADVAYSVLMEMRNTLMEAYRELQQMRG